jgi:hypothetical protein
MATPAQQADQLALVAALAHAMAALHEATVANPAWGSFAAVTLPADLDAAVAASRAWLEGVALPWCASLDGLQTTLPPLRVPGQS